MAVATTRLGSPRATTGGYTLLRHGFARALFAPVLALFSVRDVSKNVSQFNLRRNCLIPTMGYQNSGRTLASAASPTAGANRSLLKGSCPTAKENGTRRYKRLWKRC
jgi:hypothetical protein